MIDLAGASSEPLARPPIQRFEDLEVWKEAMRLSLCTYRKLRKCHDFGLRNQMQRAAVSIPSNIAEGFERGTTKKFVRFLRISMGSCAELRTQIYLAIRLNVIEKEVGADLLELSRKISAMLARLIRARLKNY